MTLAKCTECKHARWQTTSTGRIKKGVAGKCSALLPAYPAYLSVYGGSVSRIPSKGGIWPDLEGRCDAFELIEARNILPGQVDMGEVWEAEQ